MVQQNGFEDRGIQYGSCIENTGYMYMLKDDRNASNTRVKINNIITRG